MAAGLRRNAVHFSLATLIPSWTSFRSEGKEENEEPIGAKLVQLAQICLPLEWNFGRTP